MTLVQGITAWSVGVAVIVSNISTHGQYNTPLPKHMRSIIVWLAQITFTNLYFITSEQETNTPPTSPKPNPYNIPIRNGLKKTKNESFDYSFNMSLDSDHGIHKQEIDFLSSMTLDSYHLAISNGLPDVSDEQLDGSIDTSSIDGRQRDIDAIYKFLEKAIMNKEETDDDLLKNEWEESAKVIDRCLFWVFLLVTASISVACLVLLPLGKPDGLATVRNPILNCSDLMNPCMVKHANI